MPLQIEENMVDLPEDFNPKDWRAVKLWRELKDDGREYFFGFLLKYYGPGDFGRRKDEEVYIGRKVKYIQDKTWDLKKGSKTFGERIEIPAEEVTEEEWSDRLGKYVPVKGPPINATKTYQYVHDASDDKIVKMYKALVGSLTVGRTQFYFVSSGGSRIDKIDNEEDFFNTTVKKFVDTFLKTRSIYDSEKKKQERGSEIPESQPRPQPGRGK